MEHKLFHIVAASGDAMVIGNENNLPWPKYSEDLRFFKAMTGGHTIIMGRKTFESIGKALPNRENIVLSRSDFQAPPGVKVFSTLDEAIKNASSEDVFVVGGAELYRQTIEQANGIYLTKVPGEPYPGDTAYPEIPTYFKPNAEKTQELREKYKIDIVYLENTATGK